MSAADSGHPEAPRPAPSPSAAPPRLSRQSQGRRGSLSSPGVCFAARRRGPRIASDAASPHAATGRPSSGRTTPSAPAAATGQQPGREGDAPGGRRRGRSALRRGRARGRAEAALEEAEEPGAVVTLPGLLPEVLPLGSARRPRRQLQGRGLGPRLEETLLQRAAVPGAPGRRCIAAVYPSILWDGGTRWGALHPDGGPAVWLRESFHHGLQNGRQDVPGGGAGEGEAAALPAPRHV